VIIHQKTGEINLLSISRVGWMVTQQKMDFNNKDKGVKIALYMVMMKKKAPNFILSKEVCIYIMVMLKVFRKKNKVNNKLIYKMLRD
jgi:hypothetical protein